MDDVSHAPLTAAAESSGNRETAADQDKSPITTYPSSDRLLNQREVADLLGVTERTIERWRGDISGPPYIRLGPRRLAYSEKAVQKWMNRRTFSHRAAELSAQATARPAQVAA